jgi:RNA polymerase sigma-70 factor (ECF subfamily)
MSIENPTEYFIQALTESQNRLYGYIFSLVGEHHAASDILQECNLVLWRKFGEFRPESDFIPWAFAIARFQVLAHLRDRKRSDARFVSPEIVELLHDEVAEQAGEFEEMRLALRQCLSKLAPTSRELVENRYFRKLAIQAIAEETSRNLSAVKVALMRVRLALRECIDRQMRKADAV